MHTEVKSYKTHDESLKIKTKRPQTGVGLNYHENKIKQNKTMEVIIMRKLTTDEMWSALLDMCVVSEETLNIVTAINGYNEDTLLDVLYAATGYKEFEDVD